MLLRMGLIGVLVLGSRRPLCPLGPGLPTFRLPAEPRRSSLSSTAPPAWPAPDRRRRRTRPPREWTSAIIKGAGARGDGPFPLCFWPGSRWCRCSASRPTIIQLALEKIRDLPPARRRQTTGPRAVREGPAHPGGKEPAGRQRDIISPPERRAQRSAWAEKNPRPLEAAGGTARHGVCDSTRASGWSTWDRAARRETAQLVAAAAARQQGPPFHVGPPDHVSTPALPALRPGRSYQPPPPPPSRSRWPAGPATWKCRRPRRSSKKGQVAIRTHRTCFR